MQCCHLLSAGWAAVGLLAPIFFPANAPAASDEIVYADALNANWDNWSWGTQDLTNPSAVHSGPFSIRKVVSSYEGAFLAPVVEPQFRRLHQSIIIFYSPVAGGLL